MPKTAIRTMDGASRWLPSRTGRALYAPARAHADRSQSEGRRPPMRGRRAPGMAGRQPQLLALREENMDTQERHDVYRQFCEELGEEGFDTSAFSELV